MGRNCIYPLVIGEIQFLPLLSEFIPSLRRNQGREELPPAVTQAVSEPALSAHVNAKANADAMPKCRPLYSCFCDHYGDDKEGASANKLADLDHVCQHLFIEHGFTKRQVDDEVPNFVPKKFGPEVRLTTLIDMS